MKFRNLTLALASFALMGGPALAQETTSTTTTTSSIPANTLLKGVDESTLRAIAETAGATDIQTKMLNGQPYVQFSLEGLNIVAYGTACAAESTYRNCKGMMVLASFNYDKMLSREDLNFYNMKWSAAGVHQNEQNQVVVTRYVILDYGQTLENLALSHRVLSGVASQLQTLLYPTAE